VPTYGARVGEGLREAHDLVEGGLESVPAAFFGGGHAEQREAGDDGAEAERGGAEVGRAGGADGFRPERLVGFELAVGFEEVGFVLREEGGGGGGASAAGPDAGDVKGGDVDVGVGFGGGGVQL
jgi:hypothetical protein